MRQRKTVHNSTCHHLRSKLSEIIVQAERNTYSERGHILEHLFYFKIKNKKLKINGRHHTQKGLEHELLFLCLTRLIIIYYIVLIF
jgi:hypothetical protein